MKLRQTFIFALVASALLLQACGANTQSAIQTGIAQTLQISQLQTAAAGGGQPQTASATPEPGQPNTPAPPSDTPTITLTPTSSIPYVSVNQNTNCRTGPSQFYGLVTTINIGEQVEVLKTYNASNYVVVRNPHGSGDCWLWLQYANETNFSAYNLPLATQPPTPTNTATPTPSFNWVGGWGLKAVNGGTTFSGSGTFAVSGQAISGSFTLNPGGWNYTFTGTLNSSLQTANGNWTLQGGGSGTFSWQIKSGNVSQFVGNLDSGSWEFCGWRSGSSEPSPCEWP